MLISMQAAVVIQRAYRDYRLRNQFLEAKRRFSFHFHFAKKVTLLICHFRASMRSCSPHHSASSFHDHDHDQKVPKTFGTHLTINHADIRGLFGMVQNDVDPWNDLYLL